MVTQLLAVSKDRHGAIRQYEELGSGSSLPDHGLTLAPVDLVGEIRDHPEFLLRAGREQRDSGDQINLRVFVEAHGAIVNPREGGSYDPGIAYLS